MRKLEENIFKALMMLATAAIATGLFLIVWTVAKHGLPAMSWDMITKVPGEGFYLGKEGGLLNAIAGSVFLVLGSLFLGLLISIPVVIFINLYQPKKSKLSDLIRLSADVLFGIPSVVFGAFAFTLMVYLGLQASLLAGILAVTFLILPLLVRSLDEVVRQVPVELKDATLSLGATRLELMKVVLKQIRPGITTAIMLSVGRAIGDAAAVLFTAGYTDHVPASVMQPAATLPLAVFFQINSPIGKVQDRGYAAALILTLIVLSLSLTARHFSRKFTKTNI